jgi:YVTN family beta-propeller protein
MATRLKGWQVLYAATLLALVLRTDAMAADPGAGGKLYVSDERGGTVVVVDATSGDVLSRIAVGKRPRGLALSPDGARLYMALSGSAIAGPGVDESKLPPPDRRADGIGVIDIATSRLIATFESGPDPETFAVSPDGKTLYVSNEDTGRLSAVDTVSGKIRASAAVGIEPEGVSVRPDGKVVYVTCEGDSTVHAMDATTLATLATIPTKPRPRAIAFSRDGKRGMSTDEIGMGLTVFDTTTHAVLDTVSLASAGNPLIRPMGIVASPDGRSIYVTTGRGGSLLEVDLAGRSVRRTIAAVGQRPWGLALSTDGRKAFTANGPSGDISIIDLDRGVVEKRIKVGDSPWGIVYAK